MNLKHTRESSLLATSVDPLDGQCQHNITLTWVLPDDICSFQFQWKTSRLDHPFIPIKHKHPYSCQALWIVSSKQPFVGIDALEGDVDFYFITH